MCHLGRGLFTAVVKRHLSFYHHHIIFSLAYLRVNVKINAIFSLNNILWKDDPVVLQWGINLQDNSPSRTLLVYVHLHA